MCSALGCTNTSKKGLPLSFHVFPLTKPHLLKQWVLATKRRNWQPTKCSKLCNDHFTDDCFKSHSRHLKSGAVPTIFNFPTLRSKRKLTSKNKIHYKLEIQKKVVTSPIIIKDFQRIPSNSPVHDHQANLSSREQSSTTFENVQHTSSSSSLHSQQLYTLPQKDDGESPIITADIQSTSSNSSVNSEQVIISSETRLTPTTTENIQSFFPLNSKQSLSLSEQICTEDPTNNANLQSFFSNFLLSEQEMIINVLREQNPVHASSLENPTDSGNISDSSMDIPQQQLASPEGTVEDQACNKSDSSPIFQKITSSLEEKCTMTEVSLLREKVGNLETDIKERNEKIFKLKKLLELALKYIGIPVNIEHLLRDESVLQCLLES